MKKETQIKNRVYHIIGKAPLSVTLNTRNTRRNPLMYFDTDKNQNRALRYSSNQPSPFEDEQDKNIILEPIVFERGQLFVPKENQVLQKFLHLHPKNGLLFMEHDPTKNAADELAIMDLEDQAIEAANGLKLDMIEMVCRVSLSLDVDKLTTPELKRDVRKYARRSPREFLDIINDPKLKLYGKVAGFFDDRKLTVKNKGRDVYFNLKDNKKRMLVIPFGEEPIATVSSYLQTDEGMPVLRLLEEID